MRLRSGTDTMERKIDMNEARESEQGLNTEQEIDNNVKEKNSSEQEIVDLATQSSKDNNTETMTSPEDATQALLRQMLVKINELTSSNQQIQEQQEKLNNTQTHIQEKLNNTQTHIQEQLNSTQTQIQIQIQETIEKGNTKLEQQIKTQIKEVQDKIEINNTQIREEVAQSLGRVQKEIEKNVSRMEDNLRAEVGATKEQARENNTKICENSSQLSVLESRVIQLNSQIEIANKRITISENEIRNNTRGLERNTEEIKSQLSSLRSVKEKDCDRRNANDNDRDLEHIPVIQIEENEPTNGQSSHRENNDVHNNVRQAEPQGQFQNFTLNEIKLPRFAGAETDHPLRYIKDLELYFEIQGVPNRLKLSIVKNSLIKQAIWWFDLHSTSINNYSDFKALFLQDYWSVSRQQAIRVEIVNGRYEARRHGNYSEYFIMLMQKAGHLSPPIPLDELLSCIAKHYPSEIRAALVISRPKSTKEMLQLLRELQPSSNPKNPSSDLRGDAASGTKREANFSRGEWAERSTNSSPEEKKQKNVSKGAQKYNNDHGNNTNHNNGIGRYQNNGTNNSNNFQQSRNQGPTDQGNRFTRNNTGSWSRNPNHNNGRNPRINHMNFYRPFYNNWAHVPHWWKNPRYNYRPWRAHNNGGRFAPYRNNNGRQNNHRQGNNGQQWSRNNGRDHRRTAPADNPEVLNVSDEQVDRIEPQVTNNNANNNNGSLNGSPVQG